MKRPSITIIAFFLTAATACAAPVTLRYKTSPGDLYYYADHSTTSGSIRFLSTSGEPLNAVPINRKIAASTRMDTVSVEDGAATIHIQVEKLQVADNGVTTLDFDRKKVDERREETPEDLDSVVPYAMTLDELGNVLDFEKLEKKGGRADKFDWKKMSTVMQTAFPEEPVDIGDEWVSTVSMVGEPSPFDIKNVTRQFKLVGFEEVKGLDCAKIRFKTTIENARGMAQDFIETLPPEARPEVESTSFAILSDVYFAHAEGVLVAIEAVTILKIGLSMTAPVDGVGERVKVEGFFRTESVYELE